MLCMIDRLSERLLMTVSGMENNSSLLHLTSPAISENTSLLDKLETVIILYYVFQCHICTCIYMFLNER